MGDVSVMISAAEEGGSSNFLLPNGTFFFVLAIFLVVLGVIGKFVVPPIQQVLGEREQMVVKTAEENRKAAEQEASAEADYAALLGGARTEAAGIRDEARAEGRKILDDMRGRANEESAAALARATEELKRESDAIAVELTSSAETLSARLASRVLGVEITGASTGAGR